MAQRILNKDNRGNNAPRFIHSSLHRNREVSAPKGFLTKLFPRRPVSNVFRDQEMEWEFILEHREKVFAQHGITSSSSEADKVKVLADDIARSHKSGGRAIPNYIYLGKWPANNLAFKTNCGGAANALIALCATMQIPARNVTGPGHNMAEVYVDGKWCFGENAGWIEFDDGNSFIAKSAARIRTNPLNPSLKMSMEQRYYYSLAVNGTYIFGQPDGIWATLGFCRQAHLTPQTVEALYPGDEDIAYKSLSPDSFAFLWGKPRRGAGEEQLKLYARQAFARKFRLDSLERTKKLVVTFYIQESDIPEDGRGWFVIVNDQQYFLKDMKDLNPGKKQNWNFSFDVPLRDLEEHDWNWIGIGEDSSGRGQYMWFYCTDSGIEPIEACHLSRLFG